MFENISARRFGRSRFAPHDELLASAAGEEFEEIRWIVDEFEHMAEAGVAAQCIGSPQTPVEALTMILERFYFLINLAATERKLAAEYRFKKLGFLNTARQQRWGGV